MPISGCHDLPLATFNLPSRNSSQSNRKRIPQNKNPSCRHSVAACLTTPVVNTSLLQPPSVQTATTSFRNFHFAQAEGKYPLPWRA